MQRRLEVAPSAEGVDLVTKLCPFANIGQRLAIRLVALARNAVTLRHYERVEMWVAVVVAPRPDMAKGTWEHEVRAGVYLRGKLPVCDRSPSGRNIDKYRESGRGYLV